MLKPHVASLINALTLIAFGAWAYFGTDDPSTTALIPVGFGVVLLCLFPGIKSENKVVAHIAVLFTLLILLGLFMPLMGAIGRGSAVGVFRVAGMIATTIFAMVAFVQSFIAVRRQRKAEG